MITTIFERLLRVALIGIASAVSMIVFAQQPQGPILNDETRPGATQTPASAQTPNQASPYATAPGPTATSDGGDAGWAPVVADFKLLKILGFCAVALSVVVGLVVYSIRHRRLQKFDTVLAAIITTVLAPVLLFLATKVLATDSAACLGMALSTGADASAFSDGCRTARESLANMFGLKSLWTMITGQTIVNGVIVPLAAGLVKGLIYVSVTLAAPVIFLLLKPIIKRTLYKN